MKIISTIIFLCSVTLMQAQEPKIKPAANQQQIQTKSLGKGVAIKNDAGVVIRYNQNDTKGKLLYYVIPNYTSEGQLLENRKFDAQGNLQTVIVFIGDKVVALDKEGNKIVGYENTIFQQSGPFNLNEKK